MVGIPCGTQLPDSSLTSLTQELELVLQRTCTFISAVIDSVLNDAFTPQVILIPRFAAQTCLVLGTSITPEEHAFCGMITKRSYGMIDKEINGIGNMTAANVMDIAKLTVDGGLVSKDIAILTELYARVHGEMVVKDGEKVDGIRPDGSFGQFDWALTSKIVSAEVFSCHPGHHEGVIYNGNYGKRLTMFRLNVNLLCEYLRREGLVSLE